MKRNCPNCGAPFELDKIKCEYCGTLSLDLTCLNLTENTPVFIRYKVPFDKKSKCFSYSGKDHAYITQCAIPHLDDMTVSYETSDICGSNGIVSRVCGNRTCQTSLRFDAIPFGENKSLFEINVETVDEILK